MDPCVRKAYQEYDVAAERILKKLRADGTSIPCARGCHACCYDVAWAHRLEVAEIAERIRSWPRKVRERVLQGLRGWLEGMLRAGLDPDHKYPDVRVYHRAKLRCPLLSDEGECMAYDVRPMACRGHYVVAPDASVCANRAEEPEIETVQFVEPIVQAMVTMFDGRYVHGGLPKDGLFLRLLGLEFGVEAPERSGGAPESVRRAEGPSVASVSVAVSAAGKEDRCAD